MIDNVTFGGFVRTLRKEKQMTQLELAKILNLSDKTISKWEQGKAFPDIAVWEALAEALDVTVAELFAGEKLPKEEGKVSAAVFEDGIAVAANEVRQKKKPGTVDDYGGAVSGGCRSGYRQKPEREICSIYGQQGCNYS